MLSQLSGTGWRYLGSLVWMVALGVGLSSVGALPGQLKHVPQLVVLKLHMLSKGDDTTPASETVMFSRPLQISLPVLGNSHFM